MFIYENLIMLLKQIANILYSPFNRLLILTCSSQIASMLVKVIIDSVKNKKISFKKMASYGGMPSSHTAFIASFVFGVALDPDLGWQHPLFTLSLVISALVLIDTVRLRGTVDRLNDAIGVIVDENEELKNKVKLPKKIAHTLTEVIGGLVFAFIYVFVFYLFLYNVFPH